MRSAPVAALWVAGGDRERPTLGWRGRTCLSRAARARNGHVDTTVGSRQRGVGFADVDALGVTRSMGVIGLIVT